MKEGGTDAKGPDEDAGIPAIDVTRPCLHFIMKRTEHREFVQFYHEIARMAVDGRPTESERKDLYLIYISKKQFFLENYLCNIHDFLVQYTEGMIFEMIATRPDLLSEEELTRRKINVPQDGTEEDRRYAVAADVASQLAKDKLTDIGGYFRRKVGIDMFPPGHERDLIIVLSALRNLVVHNNGEPNDRFARRISGVKFSYETMADGRLKLDEAWLIRAAASVERIVFKFDRAMATALNIPTRNRYGAFWLRGV